MEFVDLTEITVSLLLISAITNVIVDLMKTNIVVINNNSEIKGMLSILISVIIVAFTQVSIFEATTGPAFYFGILAAGLIAGLGSNFIHEIMKVLQTVKTLKEKK